MYHALLAPAMALAIMLGGVAAAEAPPAAEIKTLVRADTRLSALDRQLGDVLAYASRPEAQGAATARAAQRDWLADSQQCLTGPQVAECLAGRYALRIADLSASSGWPPARPPLRLRCDGDPPVAFTITYYATDPGTLVAEHRDMRIAMLERQMASGVQYEGGGASYTEHQGEAAITWPGQPQPLRCLWR